MDASVLVIGPAETLIRLGVADYPDDYYKDVPDEAIILGTVARAVTTQQSHILAGLCGVDPWDLGNHRIMKPISRTEAIKEYNDDYVGYCPALNIWTLLDILAAAHDVMIWFQPNG